VFITGVIMIIMLVLNSNGIEVPQSAFSIGIGLMAVELMVWVVVVWNLVKLWMESD